MRNRLLSILLVFFSGGLFSQQAFGSVLGQPQLASDSLGNRIPDFSYCGYKASDAPIPDVSIKIVVPQQNEDATNLIQQAIDQLAQLPVDNTGFRGAVLLQAGDYKVSGSLKINASGIVLRGSGCGENGTRLIATGKDRRTLIRIAGIDDRQTSDTLRVADSYVPVGAMELTVTGDHHLKAGDKVIIMRHSTKEWIDMLGAGHFGGGITALGWKPGEQNIYWDKTIVSVTGNRIAFDAPVTTALDKQFGGGYVIPYLWKSRIADVGIENMQCVSEYDIQNPKDEAHSWMAVTMENVSDAWVRNVNFKHFAGSAVYVLETANRITVENCKSQEPVSEIGGQRRYTFFTMGQQCLFQRLYAEQGYHDFSVGFCAPGPNAFVQCYASLPYSFSGPVDSWASGVLYDNVNIDGNALSYKNLMQDEQGAGWNAANSVFWQCSASRIDCFAPPSAQNWAFGSWSEFSGNGYWKDSNNHIQPLSLFYSQLKERLGEKYVDRAYLLTVKTNETSSPTVKQAEELVKASTQPATTLFEWIDQVIAEHPISTDTTALDARRSVNVRSKLKTGVNAGVQGESLASNTTKAGAFAEPTAPLSIKNGWLVRGDAVQTGKKHDVPWWNGTVQPAYLKTLAKPHITRFVPGRTGTGLTDDLDEVTDWMKKYHIVALDHNYGLWYDRRRDDHERIRRINGDVLPPFYEQPFARSGEGTAYDGLSKYDLTKYNDWYWRRLKQFVDLADQKGLILLHQNFFQHNILEAGAHWVDCPWRTANNINNTGFPEPVPFAGDKRQFMAEQFYDASNPVRRPLYEAYIRQCLNNFRGNNSVIQLISAEYTGPLHFVQFWLDVIAQWEKETGEKQLIALSATKDVQDAILADSVRSSIVDIIDIRYWLKRDNGSYYEPQGGKNLAPRQFERQIKKGNTSFDAVYQAVLEYKTKFPGKAVMYYSDAYPQYAWASFMAGGSLACLPEIKDEAFLKAASKMKPMPELNTKNIYILGNPLLGYIIYQKDINATFDFNSIAKGKNILYLNPETGIFVKDKSQIGNTKNENLLIWIKK